MIKWLCVESFLGQVLFYREPRLQLTALTGAVIVVVFLVAKVRAGAAPHLITPAVTQLVKSELGCEAEQSGFRVVWRSHERTDRPVGKAFSRPRKRWAARARPWPVALRFSEGPRIF